MTSPPKPLKRHIVEILDVKVDDISFDNALEAVLNLAKSVNTGKTVVTVNSEFIMLARRNAHFKKILEKADLFLPDGQWVVNSKLILGGTENDRVTGVDLLEKLCKKIGKKPIRVGFLGGFDSVAEKVAKRQQSVNPRLKVVISAPGNPAIGYDSRLKGQFSKIGRVDILFVAYGMGKQEFWIERMKNKLDVGVFIGVGGAFDYIARRRTRAPRLLQRLHSEWLWRLFAEPTRLWRMRVLPQFFVLVLLQFLKTKLNFKKI